MSTSARTTTRRRHRATAAALLACALSAPVVAAPVAAAPLAVADDLETGDDPQPFYTPPAEVPTAPGTLIRSEPAPLLLDPLGLSSSAVTATRVMYSSQDSHGRPIAVTGTVFSPRTPWAGAGQRPVVGFAVGTQGLADRCAPSRQMAEAVEYEGPSFAGLIARGYTVTITDYEGLGTPGVHTYMARASQGHAVLDSIRAARSLPGSEVTPDSPVGLMGYSQGGGAAASAAELAATYAPELDARGAAIGAPPAELGAVGRSVDGGMYAAVAFYAIRGVAASEGIPLRSFLNEHGVEVMNSLSTGCVTRLPLHSGEKSEDSTVDGRPLDAYLAEEPFRSAIAAQRIGRVRPAMPTLVTHSLLDDIIPYPVGRQLAEDWCDQGATVRFNPLTSPTHVGSSKKASEDAYDFLEARFAGLPAVSTCAAL